jgi:transcription elongation factor Elf1
VVGGALEGLGRRRRRKVVKIVKKTLPKIFVCPRCGGNSVKVIISSGGKALVKCSLCGLNAELEAQPNTQPVDLYCRFTDLFYAGKLA